MARLRVGVVISGRGSNLQALIASCSAEAYPAEIALVISNQTEAPGLGIAAASGIPAVVIPHRDRRAFAAEAQPLLCERRVELVCLAGFMRILSADFVEQWVGRILNVHPSLLPELRGLRTHERALAERRSEHGCTVHHVLAELDAGPIVAQARVPILPGDNAETLAARVLAEEHRIYPEALKAVANALRATRVGTARNPG